MTTFAIIAQEENAGLTAAVQGVFARNFYKFGPGQFVVSTSQFTAQGVTTALGAENGQHGSVVVFAVDTFWGYHDEELWTWFATKGAA